jgi:pyruvate formate lyase activating enzyme
MNRSDPTALVLEIQRMSTEDGPGLRTTLFLKGCSLRCRWCHNPESIAPGPQLFWTENRCIHCGACVGVCPEKALEAGVGAGAGGIRIDRNRCTACGRCIEECPAAALEIWGYPMTVQETVSELLKDRAYFGSDGGVTVSGGEACLQADFVAQVFRSLQEEGVQTALDSCGMCRPEQFLTAIEHADLVLFDIKETDPHLHREFTGALPDTILSNFRLLLQKTATEQLHEQAWGTGGRKRIWVRTPIIPGMTDREENIRGIAKLLLEEEALIDRWELCAFNKLCTAKYHQLGQTWELAASPLIPASLMKTLIDAALSAGWSEEKIAATGGKA